MFQPNWVRCVYQFTSLVELEIEWQQLTDYSMIVSTEILVYLLTTPMKICVECSWLQSMKDLKGLVSLTTCLKNYLPLFVDNVLTFSSGLYSPPPGFAWRSNSVSNWTWIDHANRFTSTSHAEIIPLTSSINGRLKIYISPLSLVSRPLFRSDPLNRQKHEAPPFRLFLPSLLFDLFLYRFLITPWKSDHSSRRGRKEPSLTSPHFI